MKQEYVVLDETPENGMPQVRDTQQQHVIPQSPISVRHSTQLNRPPEKFSPSLYSILLNDLVN